MKFEHEERLRIGDDFAKWAFGVVMRQWGIYSPPYDTSLMQGVCGESPWGVEYKRDRKAESTGNHYAETEERWDPSQEWRPAGAFHERQPMWIAFGDIPTNSADGWVVLVPSRIVRRECEHGGWRKHTGVNSQSGEETSRGVLIPLHVLVVGSQYWDPNDRIGPLIQAQLRRTRAGSR